MNYVVGFVFNPIGTKVNLILKQKPDWMRNKFNGIGGKIEENESPLDAMEREAEEEAGMTWSKWQPFCILHVKFNGATVFCFSTFTEEKIVRDLSDERIYEFNVDGLPASILPNARWLIQMALSLTIGEQCGGFEIKET